MADVDNKTEPSPRTLAELSALADGTLAPERAGAVRQLIASSPDLRERYEQERRAVDALHAIRGDRAPAGLRMRIDERQRAPRRRRRPLMYGGVLATAVVVAALVLLLPNGTPGAPSVSQAAALSLRGPVLGPPAAFGRPPGDMLHQDVQDIYFPNLSRSFGWQASGQRIDRIDGRMAKTVYYLRDGRQIAYTILAAPALKWPTTRTYVVERTHLQSFRTDGRLVVTWRRAGHTCVLSAQGVSAAELSNLAAREPPGLAGY